MNRYFKEEKEYIAKITERLPNDGTKDFVNNYLNFYIHKAASNRHIYYLMRVLEVSLPAICSTIIALKKCLNMNDCFIEKLTIVLSLITTVLLGLNIGETCKEKWIHYRSSAEQCKIEIENYLIDENPEHLKKYLNNFQDVHKAETRQWKIERSKDDKKEKQ